jgi:guanylate kinase
VTYFLLVLSSPSGGGKSTIARKLVQGRDDVSFSVSATTRRMRSGEKDGKDYHFLSDEEFDRRLESGGFVEWASYGDRRYGTLMSEVQRIFEEGSHAVLDIEIEGARQVRRKFPDAVTVFLLPPSGAELAARLRGRDTENEEQIARRLARAQEELRAASEYDYVVVNDDLVVAVEQVAAIVEAESLRVTRRQELSGQLEDLQRGVAEAQSPASKQLKETRS